MNLGIRPRGIATLFLSVTISCLVLAFHILGYVTKALYRLILLFLKREFQQSPFDTTNKNHSKTDNLGEQAPEHGDHQHGLGENPTLSESFADHCQGKSNATEEASQEEKQESSKLLLQLLRSEKKNKQDQTAQDTSTEESVHSERRGLTKTSSSWSLLLKRLTQKNDQFQNFIVENLSMVSLVEARDKKGKATMDSFKSNRNVLPRANRKFLSKEAMRSKKTLRKKTVVKEAKKDTAAFPATPNKEKDPSVDADADADADANADAAHVADYTNAFGVTDPAALPLRNSMKQSQSADSLLHGVSKESQSGSKNHSYATHSETSFAKSSEDNEDTLQSHEISDLTSSSNSGLDSYSDSSQSYSSEDDFSSSCASSREDRFNSRDDLAGNRSGAFPQIYDDASTFSEIDDGHEAELDEDESAFVSFSPGQVLDADESAFMTVEGPPMISDSSDSAFSDDPITDEIVVTTVEPINNNHRSRSVSTNDADDAIGLERSNISSQSAVTPRPPREDGESYISTFESRDDEDPITKLSSFKVDSADQREDHPSQEKTEEAATDDGEPQVESVAVPLVSDPPSSTGMTKTRSVPLVSDPPSSLGMKMTRSGFSGLWRRRKSQQSYEDMDILQKQLDSHIKLNRALEGGEQVDKHKAETSKKEDKQDSENGATKKENEEIAVSLTLSSLGADDEPGKHSEEDDDQCSTSHCSVKLEYPQQKLVESQGTAQLDYNFEAAFEDAFWDPGSDEAKETNVTDSQWQNLLGFAKKNIAACFQAPGKNVVFNVGDTTGCGAGASMSANDYDDNLVRRDTKEFPAGEGLADEKEPVVGTPEGTSALQYAFCQQMAL